MMNRPAPIFFLAALLFFTGSTALAAGQATRNDSGDEAPATTINGRYLLVDVTKGQTVSNQDFRGRYQLITFGYTYCPDICPTTLANMAEVLKLLGEDAARVQPLFVTVDPERDTAAILHRYTTFFDERIHGLTGSPELIRRTADNFNVRYEKVANPSDPPDRYAVDHTAGMYLLGPDAGFITKFGYSMPAREIADRIRAQIHPDGNEPGK